MTDPVGPIDRSARVRRIARQALITASGEGAGDGAPQSSDRVSAPADEPSAPPRNGAAAFAAQVMGQGGQKRGLRGGPETLDRARTTYLETEWSGGADRRIARGKIAKTEI
jgi:hypothetical protein